jgi:hypothetical protein
MKVEINKLVNNLSKKNEINIFRAMASAINKTSKSLFVIETHGKKGWVKYFSKSTQTSVRKEISDLLIVSYDINTKTTKISFLQAKYHKTQYKKFLYFLGDYFQLELLKERPDIDKNNFFGFPQNILSFTTFKTISSYGIFFYDKKKRINMLFSIPELIYYKTMRTDIKYPKTTLIFKKMKSCPQFDCAISNNSEAICICDLDIFEFLLLSYKIGAPINNTPIEGFIRNIVKNIIYKNEDNELLRDIFNSLNENSENFDYKYNGNPNMLFILSDSRLMNS